MPKVTDSYLDFLPDAFCWTRYGSESGETVTDIFCRKEVERQRNGGIFMWGIGNGLGPSLLQLLRYTDSPRVVFSPIRGRPRTEDAAPDQVVMWNRGVGIDGKAYELPKGSLVTSRVGRGRRSAHFALVCEFEAPLAPSQLGTVDFAALRNIRSGSRLGSSQVTSVVRRAASYRGGGGDYVVTLVARLAAPYLVRLNDPMPVPDELRFAKPGSEAYGLAVEQALALRAETAHTSPRQPVLV
jgi:hypothetical protein